MKESKVGVCLSNHVCVLCFSYVETTLPYPLPLPLSPILPSHPPLPFLLERTGGADVLLELRGKNGTSAFHDAHGTSPSSAPHKKLLRMEVKGVSAEVLALKFPKSEQVAP